MTTYQPFKVNLSEGQKGKLAKAYKTNSPLTIRLSKNQASGNDELLLTANHIGFVAFHRMIGSLYGILIVLGWGTPKNLQALGNK